ncbi:hypothetical protein NE237_000797 [Protea cynaroides]|uniref:non-specific serine/threonine protein kinase n=1 Tax=Protea cynaroides TaxID=273540 RepID=A0A9Q0KST2_9MAGN|nr:hypothetical protein NE237_000797 [Protea cynaroides]
METAPLLVAYLNPQEKDLIPNASTATVRVGKRFSIKSMIKAALPKFMFRCAKGEHMSYENSPTFTMESEPREEYSIPNELQAELENDISLCGVEESAKFMSDECNLFFIMESEPRVEYLIPNELNDEYSIPIDLIATDNVGKRFRIAKIRAATMNFNASLMIGHGGFGRVYKGVIDDTLVVIKRSSLHSRQGLREFETEIEVVINTMLIE